MQTTALHLKTRMTPARLIASTFGVLLVSCSATRYSASPAVEELTRYVLVIEESPGGQVTHDWRLAGDFDLSRYRYQSSARGTYGRIVLASSRQRDCDEENRQCIKMCMSRPLPRGFGHITSGGRKKGGKEVWCNEQCLQPYRDCQELQGLRPQEFSAVDGAVDWLKHNHQTILVGSIVVIAGVAFVTVSAGAGLVVLAPAVLLAS
ncbi:hypothetical protein [Archangium sp.]|uniref:hypothetical protein n=1 Tax=Archangium sp. TaxID=1872627 RepID=UPI002D59C894|nr:hypothetical protein [Archangium sp.]HYO53373.1 hypothetical protein [Archangium sp.]